MKLMGIIKGKDAALVGAGMLIGSLGLRALKSAPVRQLCVQGVAAGMRARSGYEDAVERAKATFDDIVAEAEYLNAQDAPLSASDDAAEPAEPAEPVA